MIYGSVCSGIEAASVAWKPLGWRCAFLAEIEPFPRAVLKHRFPEAPLHGDFTTIEPGQYADIDLLVGGTPCQSFSIAGLRGGMADERGNLALEFFRLAQRLRPRWLVWENVPGVLSSNGGRDFGSILGALVELGYGFAYRILDAQFFGVPQRRRRVFVVGYFGDWRRAAAVLFERESLSWNPAPSRETGEIVAGSIATVSPGGGWRLGPDEAAANHLVAKPLGFGWNKSASQTMRCLEDAVDALQASETSNPAIAFTCKDYGADAGELAPTLRSLNHAESHANGGGQVAVAFQCHGTSVGEMGTLKGGNGSTSSGVPFVAQAITASYGKQPDGSDTNAGPCVLPVSAGVRRLTPRECERLQGFSDDFTLVPYRGKPAADGPRYRAIGNSMAVPVMRWIGERIALAAVRQEGAA